MYRWYELPMTLMHINMILMHSVYWLQVVLLVKDMAPDKFFEYTEAMLAEQENFFTNEMGDLSRNQALG